MTEEKRQAILKRVVKEVAAWPWYWRPEAIRREIAELHRQQGRKRCRCNCCSRKGRSSDSRRV